MADQERPPDRKKNYIGLVIIWLFLAVINLVLALEGSVPVVNQAPVLVNVTSHIVSTDNNHLQWYGGLELSYGLNQSCSLALTEDNPVVSSAQDAVAQYPIGDAFYAYEHGSVCYFESDLQKLFNQYSLPFIVFWSAMLFFVVFFGYELLLPCCFRGSLDDKSKRADFRCGGLTAVFICLSPLVLESMMIFETCHLWPGHCLPYQLIEQTASITNYTIAKQPCYSSFDQDSDCWKGILEMRFEDHGQIHSCSLTVLRETPEHSNVVWTLEQYAQNASYDVVRFQGDQDKCYFQSDLLRMKTNAVPYLVVACLVGGILLCCICAAACVASDRTAARSAGYAQTVPITDDTAVHLVDDLATRMEAGTAGHTATAVAVVSPQTAVHVVSVGYA